MGDFAHLHVHSHYSLLDGLGKPRPLIERVKELGMEAVALTDHGVMYGAVEFVRTALELGVKPIVGVEAYLAPNGRHNKRGKMDGSPRHLTLLAQNNEGYKNLIKLTTIAHLEGYYYKPRIDYETLEQHSAGVIVLSGCLNGDIAKAIMEKRPDDAQRLIEWHIEVFGKDRFYMEVQDHPNIPEQKVLNEAIIAYAQKYKLALAATNDAHYIRPEDAEAQDVLLCVQTGKQVQDQDRMNMTGDDFSLTPVDEVKEAWKEHPEAVDSTVKIAEMCNVTLEFGVHRLPRFPLPRGTTVDQALRQQCEEGLKKRYGPAYVKTSADTHLDEVRTRLDYELEVIQKTGFSSYFLIVADFVNEAKRRGILVGPGRGSAAGSLVSYLLNITDIDPLKYNLLFERFLNPERVSMPDIDLDFADDRRDEVIHYVREKYGHEHVAQIITFGTMAARAAVRDAGRALGLPYSFCDSVAKAIPPMTDFKGALSTKTDLKQMYESDPQVKRLVDMARKLEGVCRHASTHAAGVVITDEPLTEYVPLQMSTTSDNETDTVTQYAMGDVEALGLLKIDFLGLKNLTIITNTLARIKKRYGQEISLEHLPLDDEAAYKLLQDGRTTGVFQLESSGMKRYLRELKPTELEDIISMVALYRPGPMDSIPDFIAAKHGKKKITYLHPILEPILEKTYGIIVTQDQVLQIAREFSGFTYAEADILRKAVGKKIKVLLDEQREKFVKGAVEVKKIDRPTASMVWDFIEPFARYGFNRAHAACYAMVAYQTAYLKANYPAEFMAALLTSDEGNIDRAAIEVAEAVAMGLTILPPDVNESEESFTVVATESGDAIRFGLGAVKHVGHNVVAAIIAERDTAGPYKDLADLFARVDSRDFNKKSVESLARAGAFDCLAERMLVLTNADKLLNFNRALHKAQDKGQQGLFGEAVSVPPPRLILDEAGAASKEERLAWEKELLGMYVSEHPLGDFQKDLQGVATPVAELGEFAADARVRVAGVITKINKITTKSGQPMLFVEVEDMTAAVEVLVFPKTYMETQTVWADGARVVVEGKISDKDGVPKILTDKVWVLDRDILSQFTAFGPGKRRGAPNSSAAASSLAIHVPLSFSRERLKQLEEVLARLHTADGGVPVELILPHNGSKARWQTQYRVRTDQGALAELHHLVGPRAVQMR